MRNSDVTFIYLSDETKGKPIVEFVGFKPKMYFIKVCDSVIGDAQPRLTTKQVGKGIARATLKHIPHDTYLAMFREGQQEILSNKRIGSKLHTIYIMDVQKRGLVPYDDKCILLADLPDGLPNPATHAFGHYSLEAVRMPEHEQPPAGGEMVVVVRPSRNERYESQLVRKHARVVKKARGLRPDNGDDGDSNGELHGNQLLIAEREAAARPGGAIKMGDVIERIIARDHLERPVSPPARMPPTQRAGPSGLNAHLPPFSRRMDSSDDEEPERPVWPPRRPRLELEEADYEQEDTEPKPPRRRKKARRRVNPFIDAEAGVDRDVSGDEETDDENNDLDGFIVANDVEF